MVLVIAVDRLPMFPVDGCVMFLTDRCKQLFIHFYTGCPCSGPNTSVISV